MRIKKIEINNYKAFYGRHTFNTAGKNLFIYGENGSGKTSLYFALKDFFQSSIEKIDLSEVENIFIEEGDKGNCLVKVTFNPNTNGQKRNQAFLVESNSKDTDSHTSIADANKLKGFLTYKHLLEIHHVKKGGNIDLFNLLVNGVLYHFKYPLLPKELGGLWNDINEVCKKEISRTYQTPQKKKELEGLLKQFNDGFGELFKKDSPEYILKHANNFLKYFNHNIEIKLSYRKARPSKSLKSILNNHVNIEVKYAGKGIEKPHLFINEARLSAIAISIYLGMIKRHPQLIDYKVLFLDDIFIGLDIGNRLPMLKILNEHFSDYQIFLTTYDKPWYEYAKSFLEGNSNWLTMELYAQKMKEGFEIPVINDKTNPLDKAEQHLQNSDYKAAAVYARTAFEKLLKDYCDNKVKVVFKKKSKNYTSDNFWQAAKKYKTDLPAGLITEIEQFRGLVLNPFSHYNTEKHEIRQELEDAIEAIRKLKGELT